MEFFLYLQTFHGLFLGTAPLCHSLFANLVVFTFLRSSFALSIPLAYSNSMPGYAKGMPTLCQGYAKGMPVHPLLNDSTFFKFPETAFRCLNVTHCIMGIIEILVEKFPIKLLELGIFVTIDATYPTEIR